MGADSSTCTPLHIQPGHSKTEVLLLCTSIVAWLLAGRQYSTRPEGEVCVRTRRSEFAVSVDIHWTHETSVLIQRGAHQKSGVLLCCVDGEPKTNGSPGATSRGCEWGVCGAICEGDVCPEALRSEACGSEAEGEGRRARSPRRLPPRSPSRSLPRSLRKPSALRRPSGGASASSPVVLPTAPASSAPASSAPASSAASASLVAMRACSEARFLAATLPRFARRRWITLATSKGPSSAYSSEASPHPALHRLSFVASKPICSSKGFASSGGNLLQISSDACFTSFCNSGSHASYAAIHCEYLLFRCCATKSCARR
mmetsp:Transcript_51816/g.119109  ORF Transcript_51816/g.119109 Transcript_51816/m.119109 type:complete len:315 (+) Transcript_51816:308-1252(+)